MIVALAWLNCVPFEEHLDSNDLRIISEERHICILVNVTSLWSTGEAEYAGAIVYTCMAAPQDTYQHLAYEGFILHSDSFTFNTENAECDKMNICSREVVKRNHTNRQFGAP